MTNGFFRKIGTSLAQEVTLRDGLTVTLQQVICTIPGSDREQLFTGVESMGETGTVVFTHHKRYNKQARKTVSILHRVLQDILNDDSYNLVAVGMNP